MFRGGGNRRHVSPGTMVSGSAQTVVDASQLVVSCGMDDALLVHGLCSRACGADARKRAGYGALGASDCPEHALDSGVFWTATAARRACCPERALDRRGGNPGCAVVGRHGRGIAVRSLPDLGHRCLDAELFGYAVESRSWVLVKPPARAARNANREHWFQKRIPKAHKVKRLVNAC